MRALLLLAIFMVVNGKAEAQRPIPVSDPDIPLQFEIFTLKPPSGSNWYMLDRTTEGVMFGKPPPKPGHTFMAWAVARKLPSPLQDVAAYLGSIRPELERRLSPGRHEFLDAHFAPYAKYPESCVQYRLKALDRGVRGFEGVPQNFQIAGIHCIDPRDRSHSIDVNFSERGGEESWSASTIAEAESYFSGLRFREAKGRPAISDSPPAK